MKSLTAVLLMHDVLVFLLLLLVVLFVIYRIKKKKYLENIEKLRISRALPLLDFILSGLG